MGVRVVFKEQSWDGFHFERVFVTTVEEHEKLVSTSIYFNSIQNRNIHWPSAGERCHLHLHLHLHPQCMHVPYHRHVGNPTRTVSDAVSLPFLS